MLLRLGAQDAACEAVLMLNGFGVCGHVTRAWNNASLRMCADGGIDKVAAAGLRDPTHVVGDMDSITDRKKGITYIKQDCQNTTDFMKCLTVLDGMGYKGRLPVGFALGGRLDHLFTNTRTLTYIPSILPVLFGSVSLITPLTPGTTTVYPTELLTTKGVGLLPLADSPVVTTKGLRWDLTDATLGFGPSQSWTSSNHFADKACPIEITTSKPVAFTCEIYNEK
eukprot:TRINITY_DN10773_c0_g3_i1.p1 TRINITY_DN10773_c0_g3~~TRINITY_DN10773_c0_g3_i1.p1  ORF type:complete len:224 (+),score=30.71 TRINITY_DN10773_c0_g3_i1:45-716(+)